MFFTAGASLERVRAQLREMRALADSPQLLAEAHCSAWTPAEHLDHSVKVTASIINRLLDREAPRGDGGMSATGRIVLAVGRIPRGRGKSPERLRGARIGAAELHAGLTKLEGKIDELEASHLADTRGAIVPHPRFGDLRPSQALRFAAVHNDHHLRIIEDILRMR